MRNLLVSVATRKDRRPLTGEVYSVFILEDASDKR